MDLPTLEETGEKVEQATKNLIPWLEDPRQCECGAYCDATTGYVERMASYEDIWECPDCERRYYRDRI